MLRLFKTRGFRPPTATSSFTGLKEDAEKGPPLAWSTPARIFGAIYTARRVETDFLSAPVVNGGFAQWFTSTRVRAGSEVPVLSENPAHEGAGKDQAP